MYYTNQCSWLHKLDKLFIKIKCCYTSSFGRHSLGQLDQNFYSANPSPQGVCLTQM